LPRNVTATVHCASQLEQAQRRSKNQATLAADAPILLALNWLPLWTWIGHIRWGGPRFRGFTSTVNPASSQQPTRLRRKYLEQPGAPMGFGFSG